MQTEEENLKSTLRYWTLLLGVIQVTVGCLVGFIPPPAVAWFRGIVMAHLELTANGVLMIVLGLLLRELRLGAPALKLWFVMLQIGTWTNGASGLLAGFLGASSKFLPTANEKFPPPRGTDSVAVTALLVTCGVAIMVTLLLTVYGLLRARPRRNAADA